MDRVRKFLVEILDYWDTYIGLLVIGGSIIILYFKYVLDVFIKKYQDIDLYVYLIFPLLIILVVYLLWAFKSHRINLFKRKRITTGLFLSSSDYESHRKIKEIIREMILEIEDEFPDIKLKLFSLNRIRTKKALVKFVKSNHHIIDNGFLAIIHYGKCKNDSITDEKIEIENLYFAGNFNENSSEEVSISEEFRIRNLNKNWEYFESRSSEDKKKVKYNLKDSLLYFIGLYSIYMNEQDLAIKVLKYLKSSEQSIPDVRSIEFLKKSRLNGVLLKLFSFTAVEKYIKNIDLEEAFRLLKECEEIFSGNHNFTFNNYITLSRMYYERNELQKAYEYTDKANSLKNDTVATYCNYGFFGIIENNIDKVCDNYKHLPAVYKFHNQANFVDLIHFLDIHKPKYPQSKILFDFAIATINYFYVDNELGKKQLLSVKQVVNDNVTYLKIYDLVNSFLIKGEIKPSYYRRDKKIKRNLFG